MVSDKSVPLSETQFPAAVSHVHHHALPPLRQRCAQQRNARLSIPHSCRMCTAQLRPALWRRQGECCRRSLDLSGGCVFRTARRYVARHFIRLVSDNSLDMLGFKLEMPRREDNVQDKTRPIYLDMQVRFTPTPTGDSSHVVYLAGNNTS